jgi:alpha-amylase/alpha-mannosidase (GH57 family)
MTSEAPLSLLFLWHQHQPLYKDALTQQYELPWVRLHATKDYYDMVAVLDEFPTIKANFNLVPSLLTQLDDYAKGQAKDKFLDMSRKTPQELDQGERDFILQNFFMAHWETMIDPYPRYRELLDMRGRMTAPENFTRTQTYFKEQDWRDLQVWFNLAWFDPLWREKDPFIKGLFEKGKRFTEDEKQKLLDKQREICGLVVAKHKELQDRGQIEITTTPFYHPILPLLCDTESARMALPHVVLPSHHFQHPEDAHEQLLRAVNDYSGRFGHPPSGLWPSEGSVSEQAAQLIADVGIRWIATDEDVLARSLGQGVFNRDDLYEPYQFKIGDKSLHFFFRNHELSDAIGFVYASWDPEDAAKNFMEKLQGIRAGLKDKTRPHVVSVILDGENCWEYYLQDGLPFLRALYSRLAADTSIQTVRASDYLDKTGQGKPLPKLWAGSWINSNFAIWIGHAEDNTAWDLLYRTRQFLTETLTAHPEQTENPKIKAAWEEIYIAEGSDWCWWYGDDHSSANDTMFDYLFRKHLMNVYTLLGEKIPEDLHVPIKKARRKTEAALPSDFITPTLDGKVTNYFEWQAAGTYITEAAGTGTMQKAENLIKTIYYGFDKNHIYLRFDLNRTLTTETLKETEIKLAFQAPENKEINIHFGPNNQLIESNKTVGIYKKIIELGLPLEDLINPGKKPFELNIIVLNNNLQQERWPLDSTLTIPYPSDELFVENWHL